MSDQITDTFNFDEVIERTGTKSSKWDNLHHRFGRTDILPMWVADMDFQSPPCIVNALHKRVEHGVFGYTIRERQFEDAIIGWLRRRYDFDVERSWIEHSPGVVAGLGLIIRALTEPGEGVLIQPPVYYPFARTIKECGREVITNSLVLDENRYHIDFSDLEEKFASGNVRMMIFCSPHNPVSRVWSREEIERVGNLCVKYNIVLVSDEIHADFVYTSDKHTPAADVSSAIRNQTVTCLAPSKTFNVAGLHTAVVLIPNDSWRRRYQATMAHHQASGLNVFGVEALIAAYTEGDAWLDALLDYLKGNVRYVREFLAQHLPEVQLIEPDGTYLLWLDFRGLHLTNEELDALLLDEGRVGLDEGHMFGAEGSGFMRMNIGCPRVLLKRGLESIKRVVERAVPR